MKPKDVALIIVVFLLLILGAKLSSASPENPTRQELLQTVVHIEALSKETQAELEQEKLAHKGTQDALIFANSALADTSKQFNDYRTAAETEIQKGNAAITELAVLVKKHHLDLIILCGLWVGFVSLLYLKAGAMLGPVGIYAAGGLGVAGVAFIMFRL